MTNQNTTPPSLKLILWSALFSTNFIFIFLAINSAPTETTSPVSDGSIPVSYILFFAGCMSVLMSFLIPKFLKPTPQMKDFEISKFILSLAINESASIFAFIIAFIFHDHKTSYALFAISIVGYLLKFPRNSAPELTNEKNSNNLDVN